MMLKRFPWKAPRDSDDNFKLYCMPDDIDHDYAESAKHHEELLKERKEKRQRFLNHNDCSSISQQPPIHESNLKLVQNQIPTPTPTQDAKNSNKPEVVIEPEVEQKETEDNDNDDCNNDTESAPGNDKVSTKINVIADGNDNDRTHVPVDADVDTNVNANANLNTNVDKALHGQQQHQERRHSNSPDNKLMQQHKGPHHKKIIHGPYRLLRLLPHASRPIMSRILQVDPKKRATLDEIFNDEWFASIAACTTDSKNTAIRAPGPVSYTHLDVYKRQILTRVALHCLLVVPVQISQHAFIEFVLLCICQG